MFGRPDSEQHDGALVARRSVLKGALVAGAIVPFVGIGIGVGTAQAAEDSWYPIPEESGSIPWW